MSPTTTTSTDRRAGRDRVLVAVVAGVVLVLLALVVALSDSRTHLASTNTRVIFSRRDLPLLPGTQRCQGGEYVPADAARLRVFADTPAATPQPVLFTLREPGGAIAFQRRALVRSGAKHLDVPLGDRKGAVDLGTLCIRAVGRASVRFAGNLQSANPAAPAAANSIGERPNNEVRTDYLRAGRDTWWEMAGPISRRAALFRSGFVGPWAMWVAFALLAAAAALAVRLLLRTFPRA